MKLLCIILLIILLDGYSAKRCYLIGSSKDHHHGNHKTTTKVSLPTTSATSSETTTTTVPNKTDPFDNLLTFNATVVASIKLELMSALPNLTQTQFDEINSAVSMIYTLLSQIPTSSSANINSIIYMSYISGNPTLDSSTLANIAAQISNLQFNQIQMQKILSAFQLLYGVAVSLPIDVIINISSIASSASGINLPPPPPPFQNITSLNTATTDIIKAALAGALSGNQQDYFISQINVAFTVALQLPANSSSKIINSFFSAFVTGSSTLDSATISIIESELSSALPSLTSIQIKSVTNALKFIFESISTLTISSVIKIFSTIGSASGLSLPLPALAYPAPFNNMLAFDSSIGTSLKQELQSAVPSIAPVQLDFIINEFNIIYTLASRLNNNSLTAIQDIVFNAGISGETSLDSSKLLQIKNEILTALPSTTNDQMNSIIFAVRFLSELTLFLPLNYMINIFVIIARGSGIYLPPPQPPFDNLITFDPLTLTELRNNLQAALPSYNQAELDYIVSDLNILNSIGLQLPDSTKSNIRDLAFNVIIAGSASIDSQTISSIKNEIQTALPNLNQTQIGSILNAANTLYDIAIGLPFDKLISLSMILTNNSGITLSPPTSPFENMITLDSSVVASIKQQIRADIPSIVQFHLDFVISQINIIYSGAMQFQLNAATNIYDILLNEYVSMEPFLDSTTIGSIMAEVSSVYPNLTTNQWNSVVFAYKFLYVASQHVPLDVIFNIRTMLFNARGVFLNEPLKYDAFPNLVTLNSVNIAKISENLYAGVPTITQTKIDTVIYDVNVMYTLYTQLPTTTISNLNNLIYNVTTKGSLIDAAGISSVMDNFKEAFPNLTIYQMGTVLKAAYNLSEIGTLLPFNTLVNISGILKNSFSLPLPTSPFSNMLTFSPQTANSIKREILAGSPDTPSSQQDYIIFQMNIVYTVAAQLPISVLSTINSVIYAEYISLSPFLGPDTIANITTETSSSLPNIDPRQLKTFIYAIKYLYVIAVPLPFSAILNIYGYVGDETNITLSMPLPPPVFENMTLFSPPVTASIVDILMSVFPGVTASQFDTIVEALNIIYNVVLRVPISTSTTLQDVMYSQYVSGASNLDSLIITNITQELQLVLPSLNQFKMGKIISSFSILLQVASLLPINDILRITVITANASAIYLASPTPIMVLPIPDDLAVDNITAIITAVHSDITLQQMNEIIYQMDLLYTVAKMLPTDVVLNISGIAYMNYPTNGPPLTATISEALQNITEFDISTQLQMQSSLIPALPNFSINQLNDVMSAINLLHSVARSLTANAISNIVSIAYDIMGLVEPLSYA